jgi:hypothetical protein
MNGLIAVLIGDLYFFFIFDKLYLLWACMHVR